MPTLSWIGKERVMNHHQEVPYRVLEKQYTFNKDSSSGNKIIHGDNLEALKSLQPEYEGKIKCIYIDPPYNTGNEKWIYNDNVNHPQIKKWLKEVGKEGEDLSRHDKWLCMMYPRLQLLHRLLSDDGIIFISIDDNELANLKILMDEIFGPHNFIEYFSWVKTSTAPSLANKSRKTNEYILCYEKRRNARKYKAEEGDGGDAPLLNTGNARVELVFPKEVVYFKLSDGVYPAGKYERLTLNNAITITAGMADVDISLTGEFKWTQQTLEEEIGKGTTFIVKSDKFSIRYLRETETFKAPTNFLKDKYLSPLIDKVETGVDTNEGAKKELLEIFGQHTFDYPKPVSLVEFLLKFMDDKNGIVLDSFAGSGTTAHAVLNLNKKDSGNRRFILLEMEYYAETITAERIKRVIKGYGNKAGTGGDFDFYTLGLPLFTGDNREDINTAVSTEKIKEYIWYSETRSVYATPPATLENPYFIGNKDNAAYYFIYTANKPSTLDYESLSIVKARAEQYILYADSCLLPQDFMLNNNIIFKKIPRDITRF